MLGYALIRPSGVIFLSVAKPSHHIPVAGPITNITYNLVNDVQVVSTVIGIVMTILGFCLRLWLLLRVASRFVAMAQ